MSNKKGLSPLIATLLLVAFAVALGAMIINIGSSVAKSGNDCENLDLKIINQNTMCYNQQDAQSNADIRSQNSIQIDDIVFKEIIHPHDNLYDIYFIPQIMQNGKLVSCQTKKIIVKNIPSC
ncbi:MAG: archaellin/type IV pilin N-terminal domain-containing protein [Candidatus Woesearchaeota archaeon]